MNSIDMNSINIRLSARQRRRRVFLAVSAVSEMLRDPYFPLKAARELKQEIPWPVPYMRAAEGRPPARKRIEDAERY
jgi:hypothetical protein